MVARGIGLRRKFQRVPIVIVEPPAPTGGSQEPEIDVTPTAFTFTDLTDVPLSTVEVSEIITVSGLATGISVAALVVNGELQLNGGSWGTASIDVENGDELRVRHLSSASNFTTVSTTLTIGGVSDTFSSTTVAGSDAGQAAGLLLAITRAS